MIQWCWKMSSQGKSLGLSGNHAEKDTVAERNSNIQCWQQCFCTTYDLWCIGPAQTLSWRARRLCFFTVSLSNMPLFITLFIPQILIEGLLYAHTVLDKREKIMNKNRPRFWKLKLTFFALKNAIYKIK